MAADPTEFPKSGMALLAKSTKPDHAVSSSALSSQSLKAINLGYSVHDSVKEGCSHASSNGHM